MSGIDRVRVITTTPDRLAAALDALETAWIGDDRGRRISGFIDDCQQAGIVLPVTVRTSAMPVGRMDERAKYETPGGDRER